jgi:ubiquinone/menaquinone biosynthesis C-methylase UbiE
VSRASEHIELNKKKWDERSESYDARRFDYFRFFQKRVVSLARPEKGGRFLDIGCGTGWAVRYTAGLVGEGGEACGIDISPKMIERAKAKSRDDGNIHFYQADAEEIPFEDGFFDSIICTNSFHHYLHPSSVLNEVRRVLKPGGRVYIMDPSADSFIVRWVERLTTKKSPDHVKLYMTAEFRALFEEAGLKYVGTKTIVPIMKVHVAEKESGFRLPPE